MASPNIRRAKINDLETLFNFQQNMAKESEDIALDPTKLRDGLNSVLCRPELGTYYIAEHNNKPIACLLVTTEWSEWRNAHVWWIQSVYVHPDHRRQGVYRRMYEYLKELTFDDPNVAGIRLYVEQENHHARNTYKKLGMNEDRYIVCEWLKNSDH
jgi:ribosomal protein S18 acetylase RimI-like enzyme